MPTMHSLALFLAAGLALNLTPGPDMLYVAAASLGAIFRQGVITNVLNPKSPASRVIQRVTGGLFIALGARLAYGARP